MIFTYLTVIFFDIWRFPKSWGYPPNHPLLGCSIKKNTSILGYPHYYPVVRRELRSYGYSYSLLNIIKWWAKELPRVSQPHTSLEIIHPLLGFFHQKKHLFWGTPILGTSHLLIKSSANCGQVTFDAQGVPQLPVETLLAFAQQRLDGSRAIFTMKYVVFMEKNVFFLQEICEWHIWNRFWRCFFWGDLSNVKTKKGVVSTWKWCFDMASPSTAWWFGFRFNEIYIYIYIIIGKGHIR